MAFASARTPAKVTGSVAAVESTFALYSRRWIVTGPSQQDGVAVVAVTNVVVVVVVVTVAITVVRHHYAKWPTVTAVFRWGTAMRPSW